MSSALLLGPVVVVLLGACGATALPPGPLAVSKDGVETLVRGKLADARSLAVDDDALFWTTDTDAKGHVFTAPKIGGSARRLAHRPLEAAAIVGDANGIYWIEGHKQVMTLAREGGEPRVFWDRHGYGVYLEGLATSSEGIVVSMSTQGDSSRHGLLYLLGANGERELTNILAGDFAPFTLDASTAYTAGGWIHAAPLGGGEARDLGQSGSNVRALATRDDELYLIEREAIYKMPITGGDRVKLADAGGAELVVDEAWLYFYESTGKPGTTIYRVARTGGSPEPFTVVRGIPIGLVVDGDHLYWIDYKSGEISRKRR